MSKAPTTKKRIFIPAKQLAQINTRKFSAKVKGKVFNGFVVKKDDRYFAYQNLCQHLPIMLDMGSGDLFSYDKTQLQCAMHGALYEVESGRCTAGPCVGSSLVRLHVEEVEDQLVVTLPDEFESD